MIHRNAIRRTKPFMQELVARYPFSMFLSLFSSMVWGGLLVRSGSPFAMFPALQATSLMYGFVMEFKRLVGGASNIQNDFADEKYYNANGQLVAELRNPNRRTPLLEIYSRENIGDAMAHFVGRDFIEFRQDYLQYLFANAQVKVGPLFADAIDHINKQVCERGIEIDYKMQESHFFIQKTNEILIAYNKARPPALRVPLVTADELSALNNFGDVEKGLACSVAVIPKKNTTAVSI